MQRDFAVPFVFIKKDYVKALIQTPNDKGFFVFDPESTPYTWINNHTLRLDTVPPRGHRIIIRRETYADNPLVDFQDAAILIEEDLDLASLQALHVAQEARDFNLFQLESSLEALYDAQKELEETIGEAKADRIHAAQHAKNGSDPLSPHMIGALEHPPATGKNYLANSNGWVEHYQGGSIMAPAAVLVQYFETDGVKSEFVINHPFNTKNVTVSTYAFNTAGGDERVFLSELVQDDHTVVLKSTGGPLAAGMTIRCLLIAIGNGEGTNTRREFIHEQETPEETWTIKHFLGIKYLKVLVIDSDNNQAVPSVDWSTATDTEITLKFLVPTAGTAILTL